MTDTLVRPRGTNFGTPQSQPWPLDELWGRGTAPTAVPERRGIDPEVVEVLFEWGALDDKPVEVRIIEPPQDPVEAVTYLVRVLQLTQDQILDSVGIAPRTFFGWKTKGRRPRTESLGKIWPMVQAVSSMDAARVDLAAWFHSSPEAQEHFARGDANGLALLDAERSFRSGRILMPAPKPHVWEPQAEQARAPRRALVSESRPDVALRSRPAAPHGDG